MPTATVAVRRLRIRGAADTQGGVTRLLAGASVRPSGLGPDAVLAIRTLADPLPRELDPHRGTLTPPPSWEHALQGSLEEQLRGAAKPAHGPVPAAAGAVLFADRAELLACLARDWCEGAVWTRWWWRGLLREHDPDRAVRAVWQEAPRDAPPALELLADRGLAVEFVARLPPREALVLAREIATAHDLAPAPELGDSGLSEPAPEPREVDRLSKRALTRDSAVLEPAWASRVPEASAPLAAEQRALLAVALLLRRAPRIARSARFRVELRWWLRETADRGPSRRLHLDDPRGLIASAPARADPPRTQPRSAPPSLEPPGRGDDEPEIERRSQRPDSVVASRRPVPAGLEREPPPRARASPATPLEPDLATSTRLAGLFYLVGYGQHLGLYGDFTTPRQAGIALDVWDFVTLLGRRLLGRAPTDPIWALLAELAGRKPSERPGIGFRPPTSWRLPDAWLESFPSESAWAWSLEHGTLRVRHPAGFDVLAIAAKGDPRVQVNRELRRYGSPPVRRVRGRRAPPEPRLDRWVGWIADYSRARLALALGVAQRDLRHTLFEQPARVVVSPTRVDVVIPLDDLKVEVRFAGLDRDPGWVPAAGRSLAFHFE